MDDATAFYDELRRRLERPGARVALAQVVKHRGSTPRKAGARLLVDPAGDSLGTVGGGCGEADVLARAQRVLATGEPTLVSVSLLEEDGWDSDAICGGVMEVLVERVDERVGGHPAALFWQRLAEARSGERLAAIVTRLPERKPSPAAARAEARSKAIVDGNGTVFLPTGDQAIDGELGRLVADALRRSRPRSRWLEIPGPGPEPIEAFVEVVAEPPELVVVGAGHVGAALCALGAAAGFRVVVLEDRESFVHPSRLPGAYRVVLGDPRESLAALLPRPDRHVVLVTRGHRLDAGCLRVAVGLPLASLGMIGSRRRVRRIRQQLAEEGVSPAALEQVHAPIGLEIGAETPAEIALSILAQIVQFRRRG